MSPKRVLMVSLLFLIIVMGVGYSIASALGVGREQDWAPFVMTYRSESPHETLTGRLNYQSKWDWSLEITEDNAKQNSRGGLPLINYQGTRYEFKNGLYTVYGSDGTIQSQTPIEKGIFIAPHQWLVPGYDIQLKQRQGFSETLQSGGQKRFHLEQNRSCPRNPDGSLIDQTCSPSQRAVTDYIFNAKGLPLSRSITVDGQIVEKWTVIEIKDK